MDGHHICSIIICIILAVGIGLRKRRAIHMNIMTVAFVLDVLLVLWIEFTKAAVEKSIGMGEHEFPQGILAFHIVISLLTIVFYIHQLIVGRKLAGGREDLRPQHCLGAGAFIILRLSNLATSFML